jgi:predicted Fe-S protein YdhL (DUF1289 family)
MNRPVTAILPVPVPSPCTSVCKMDPASGLCLGCRRTLHEIAGWSGLADGDKQRILDQLPDRPWPRNPSRA